jgi:hypothetical protein
MRQQQEKREKDAEKNQEMPILDSPFFTDEETHCLREAFKEKLAIAHAKPLDLPSKMSAQHRSISRLSSTFAPVNSGPSSGRSIREQSGSQSPSRISTEKRALSPDPSRGKMVKRPRVQVLDLESIDNNSTGRRRLSPESTMSVSSYYTANTLPSSSHSRNSKRALTAARSSPRSQSEASTSKSDYTVGMR